MQLLIRLALGPRAHKVICDLWYSSFFWLVGNWPKPRRNGLGEEKKEKKACVLLFMLGQILLCGKGPIGRVLAASFFYFIFLLFLFLVGKKSPLQTMHAARIFYLINSFFGCSKQSLCPRHMAFSFLGVPPQKNATHPHHHHPALAIIINACYRSTCLSEHHCRWALFAYLAVLQLFSTSPPSLPYTPTPSRQQCRSFHITIGCSATFRAPSSTSKPSSAASLHTASRIRVGALQFPSFRGLHFSIVYKPRPPQRQFTAIQVIGPLGHFRPLFLFFFFFLRPTYSSGTSRYSPRRRPTNPRHHAVMTQGRAPYVCSPVSMRAHLPAV